MDFKEYIFLTTRVINADIHQRNIFYGIPCSSSFVLFFFYFFFLKNIFFFMDQSIKLLWTSGVRIRYCRIIFVQHQESKWSFLMFSQSTSRILIFDFLGSFWAYVKFRSVVQPESWDTDTYTGYVTKYIN